MEKAPKAQKLPVQKKAVKKPVQKKEQKVVINLQREHEKSTGATMGVMSVDGQHLAYTLELPWKNNQVRRSCIPKGEYQIKFRDYGVYHERYKRRFKNHNDGVLEIVGVPNRSAILIHCGNTVKDTLGCVLVGTEADTVKDIIYKSTKAYGEHVYSYIAAQLKKGLKVYIKIS
jgi:hypothetical protein